jgi:GNAT superfamily N-acetyltransferase
MTPDLIAELMEATWPPARSWRLGPFTLRDGAGGGQRVSATSLWGAFDGAALEATIAAMADPLFVIYPGDEALDKALEQRGYLRHDPVVIYAAPVGQLTGDLPFLAAFPHWPPLESAREIWAGGGIGPERVAVMSRVDGAKAAILGRGGDRTAGVTFVACHGAVAMLHALEVRPSARRQGVGGHLVRAAANWAGDQGAGILSLAVTERNNAARSLYERAGMEVVGHYHYRKPG